MQGKLRILQATEGKLSPQLAEARKLHMNSPNDISKIRAANLPSHWSRCFVPFFTRMFDPLRNSIFSFPIWTRMPLSRVTQNSFLCLCDCRLVLAPGLIVIIFTVERSFNVYWSNDPHGFLTCFNSIPRGIIFHTLET